MLSSNITVSLFKNIVCVGVLAFYFIRICNQTDAQATNGKTAPIRVPGNGAAFNINMANATDSAQKRAVFGLTEK